MDLQIRKADRKQSKIKMLLSGPSGSGKTYSSLLIAYGITNNWNDIILIDTEKGSGDLYSHLGHYNVLTLAPPFSPERYIEAINLCIANNFKVIVIDSITHEWNGKGGILEGVELVSQASSSKNSYFAWNKLTPRHTKFIEHILQAPCHIICTGRAKTEYALNSDGGKIKPTKIGMKTEAREGTDYEFTLVFELGINHLAFSSKDRTGIFDSVPDFIPTTETGKRINEWCNIETFDNSKVEIEERFRKIEKAIKNAKRIDILDGIIKDIKESKLDNVQLNSLRTIFKEKREKIKNFVSKSNVA